jgi:hypothetical protein
VIWLARCGGAWTAFAITEEDTLRRPEIAIEVPVIELYGSLELPMKRSAE